MKKLKQIKPTLDLEEEKIKRTYKTEEEGKPKKLTSERINLVNLGVNEFKLKLKPVEMLTGDTQSYAFNLVSSKIDKLKLSTKTLIPEVHQNFTSPKLDGSLNLRLNVRIKEIFTHGLPSLSKSNLQLKTAVKVNIPQSKYLLNLSSTPLKFALKTNRTVIIQTPSLKPMNIKLKTSSNYEIPSARGVIAPEVNTAIISVRVTSTTTISAKIRSFPAVQPSSLTLHGNISAGQKSMIALKPANLSLLITLKTALPQLRSDIFPEPRISSIDLKASTIQEQIAKPILSLTPKTLKLKVNIANQIREEFQCPVFSLESIKITPNVSVKPAEISKQVLKISTEDLKLEISPLQTKFEVRLTFQDLIESLMREDTMGILEELLNIKGYLPKGGSEALDKPIFVIVGENRKDWHYIIAYVLSELYREIKGEKPIPTIRELNNEDSVDSTVERFLMVNFKTWGKLEILDARNFDRSRLRSFIKKLRGRLLSSYLQGLGFFVIATRNEYIEDIEELLKDVRGIDKIIIQPEYERVRAKDPVILRQSDEKRIDKRYRKAVFSVLGIEHGDFLKAIEIRDSKIRSTVKSLSPFVPKTESESEHYPLKVAVFSWIVSREFEKSDLKPKNRDEFIRFVKGLIDGERIKIEEPVESR